MEPIKRNTNNMGHRNKNMESAWKQVTNVDYIDEHGGLVHSRESKRRRVETYQGGKLGEWGRSKQVTKRNPKNDTEFIKKTKTLKNGVWEVEKENKRRYVRKVNGKVVEKIKKINKEH